VRSDPTRAAAQVLLAEDIEQIDRQVIQLFALVGDGIAGATHALLAGDREAARALVERDEAVDALYRQIEHLVHEQLRSLALAPDRQRYLIAVLGVLPELERSGDLAEHIARRAVRGMAVEMSARARGLVERMGEVASAMWRMIADAYGNKVPDLPDRLDELDDEMDELHGIFTAELASGSMSLPVVIESVLIGRFYERLGDHAVNIARRLPVLALPSDAPRRP
jgi:phosphate transport system protein